MPRFAGTQPTLEVSVKSFDAIARPLVRAEKSQVAMKVKMLWAISVWVLWSVVSEVFMETAFRRVWGYIRPYVFWHIVVKNYAAVHPYCRKWYRGDSRPAVVTIVPPHSVSTLARRGVIF